MNILMMTNTYKPHVGGVARSVEWFTEEFRRGGHQVLIVAPSYEGAPEEEFVVRVPALQHFNGSDFSVRYPLPGFLTSTIDDFRPDVVHSHHPFLLGDSALRAAALRDLPVVFTNHTMYERYTHYVPGDSPAMKRFVIRLATEYANLCDHVIAPSESIARILRQRGVTVPITAVPTGLHPERFAQGDGLAARRRYGIPEDAFVCGHVGRLAPEKNLEFLTQAVARFLKRYPTAHFLLVGCGPSEPAILEICEQQHVRDRLHHPSGALVGQELADAYHAMDVFAFASLSETQGMVLAEAMMAGVPVVAIDAPGAREVVSNEVNGRLLPSEDLADFVEALAWVRELSAERRQEMCTQARSTAEEFTMPRCAAQILKVYESLIREGRTEARDEGLWAATLRLIEEEWKIWSGLGHAVGDALLGPAQYEAR